MRVAKDLSAWHRKRPADLHPDEVEAHLAGLTRDEYLFDRYHACASGGSSGRRGVFVYDWDGWAVVFWSLVRQIVRALRVDPAMAGARARVALIAAAAPRHMPSSVAQTFSSGHLEVLRLPVTAPIDEIVAGLNAAQPTLLAGYPSALHVLAAQVRAGRLRIAPRWVSATSEPLLPETRAALEEEFGVPVGNQYGTSEAGGTANSCPRGPWVHLGGDVVIVEPVDAGGAPVPVGVRSDKIYLTNLSNHALPLLRYEITDQIAVLADGNSCPCRSPGAAAGGRGGRAGL